MQALVEKKMSLLVLWVDDQEKRRIYKPKRNIKVSKISWGERVR